LRYLNGHALYWFERRLSIRDTTYAKVSRRGLETKKVLPEPM
jgi:hypothetical protein